MLPLGAEFKRTIGYRITEPGHMALHAGRDHGIVGAFAAKLPKSSSTSFACSTIWPNAISAREESLRSATRASRSLLAGMVRKKWIAREDLSDAQDGRPHGQIRAVLESNADGKLNANQQTLVDALAAAGGKAAVEALQAVGSSTHYSEHAGKARLGGNYRRGR